MASFFSFALQFFILKISQFYFNNLQLVLLFSVFTFGFAAGTLGTLLLPRYRGWGFTASGIAILFFLFGIHLSDSSLVFYCLSFLIFFPLGHVISEGLQTSLTSRFYFSDLLGGAFGIIYGLISLEVISIETSLLIFSTVAFLNAVFLQKSQTWLRWVPRVLSLFSALILFYQWRTDKFNLVTWSKNISGPVVAQDDLNRNAFQTLQGGRADLLLSRWTRFDRTDVLRFKPGYLVAYANNAAWTEIASEFSNDSYPYFKVRKDYQNALSVGSGGGDDFVTFKRLGAQNIIGIEANQSLVGLLQNELSWYTGNILKGVNVIANDARFYLLNDTKSYDLIFSKNSDHQSRSERYFTYYSLLRTAETVELIMKRLSDSGFAVWVVHGDENFLEAPIVSFFVSARSYLAKKNISDFKSHLIVVEKMDDPHFRSTRYFHLIFSQRPVTQELISEYFEDTSLYRIVYPSGKSEGVLGDILSGLGSYNSTDELLDYIESVVHYRPTLFTEAKPFQKAPQNISFLLINFGVCLGGALAVALGGHLKRRRQGAPAGTLRRLSLLAVATGFLYGLLQAAVLQEIEIYTPAVTLVFVIVMGLFLLSGSIASLTSESLGLKHSFMAYCALPGIVLFCYIDKPQGFISWGIFAFLLFCYFFMISMLFPKVLATLKGISEGALPLVFASNILALSAGSFAYCLFLTIFDRQHLVYLLLPVTLLGVLTAWYLVRGSLARTSLVG